mmetsp:Transcript_11435/g.34464  ORF Transcript_11435/g.34464 Transcript_11435/m.34464 type:complete len:223 (+) Transcript_11435:1014-1682(+)
MVGQLLLRGVECSTPRCGQRVDEGSRSIPRGRGGSDVGSLGRHGDEEWIRALGDGVQPLDRLVRNHRRRVPAVLPGSRRYICARREPVERRLGLDRDTAFVIAERSVQVTARLAVSPAAVGKPEARRAVPAGRRCFRALVHVLAEPSHGVASAGSPNSVGSALPNVSSEGRRVHDVSVNVHTTAFRRGIANVVKVTSGKQLPPRRAAHRCVDEPIVCCGTLV